MASPSCSYRQLGGRSSLRGIRVPYCRLVDPVAPNSALRHPQRAPLLGPSGSDRDLGAGARGAVRRTSREVRASESGRAGTGGRARGGARGRRSGRDTCGDGGVLGGRLGARGFKKVWRGAGSFPGLTEGRRAEAATAVAQGGGGRRAGPRALGVRSLAPHSRRPKKLWEPLSPAELAREAPLAILLCSRPPPSRLLSAWLPVPASPKLNERAALRGRGGGMERSSWAARTFLLALLLGATLRARAAVGYYPRFSPFFFLCTHHGELEGDGEQGEVLISLHIAGNPTYYVPGQEYHGRYHASTRSPPNPVRQQAQRFLLSFF